MKLTPLQEGLLRAIDSKDFGNVAEYLLDNGPVCWPSVVFYYQAPAVVIEYAVRGSHILLVTLVAKFTMRHGVRLVEDRTVRKRRVPHKPLFILRHRPQLGA